MSVDAGPSPGPTTVTERVLLVTGKLAEPALREVVAGMRSSPFEFEIFRARISVAALMTPDWLVGKLAPSRPVDRVILPGLCKGDVERLSQSLGGTPIQFGPADLRDLPTWLGQPPLAPSEYGAYDVEILAEINHANRFTTTGVIELAEHYRRSGADVIDLGCTPGEPWSEIGCVVRELTERGFRVSVDSFDANEVASACAAGAELVLSVNGSNREQSVAWGCEVVVIPDAPDQPDWQASLEESADFLTKAGVPYRLDPILEPIGFGLAASLERYAMTRRRFPDAPIMMGVGNLTELTAVDSAGVNAMLLGLCQELRVSSVLTTEVIHWARSSVREIDIARRLMKHAVDRRVLPKHVDDRLVTLRDEPARPMGADELRRIASEVRDPNFRIFAENGEIIAFDAHHFERSSDAFELFGRLGVEDPSHAFYLGWEMMKASMALQFGKRYVQDRSLRWGFLSAEEEVGRSLPSRRNQDSR